MDLLHRVFSLSVETNFFNHHARNFESSQFYEGNSRMLTLERLQAQVISATLRARSVSIHRSENYFIYNGNITKNHI
jgi:hypothetical protein